MELISVIIPVYKTEKYLAECLDSVLASTYNNLEIILVDDGSPDNSSGICDEYARRDPRIRVIHQKNQGVVAARNNGIRAASGAYIGFVDSDDAIAPRMYEHLAEAIRATGCDVAACEYTYSRDALAAEEPKPCVILRGIDEQLAVLTSAPSIRAKTWAGPAVWNRLYRRRAVRQLFRDSYAIGEDLLFNWDYTKNSASMAVVPAALYFYRKNEESVCAEYRRHRGAAEKGISHVRVWESLAGDPAYGDPELRRYIRARAAYMAHGELWRIYGGGAQGEYREFTDTARRLIREHFAGVWQDAQTYSLRIRGMMAAARYCFPVWAAAAKLHGLYQRYANH